MKIFTKNFIIITSLLIAISPLLIMIVGMILAYPTTCGINNELSEPCFIGQFDVKNIIVFLGQFGIFYPITIVLGFLIYVFGLVNNKTEDHNYFSSSRLGLFSLVIAFSPFLLMLLTQPLLTYYDCFSDLNTELQKRCYILGNEYGEMSGALQALPFLSFFSVPIGICIYIFGKIIKVIKS